MGIIMHAARDDDAICASFYRGATQRGILARKVMRPQYLDPAPFLPTKADDYERKMVYPLSSFAVLSRETARLRLENKSIEKRFDSLYEQAYAVRVQLKNIEAAASRETLDGSNFAAAELLKLSTRIMELLAQQPEEACLRFIPDVLACLALCHVRDKRLHAAGQRLRHALTCVSRASSQARRTVFQPIGRPAGVAPPDLKWLATVTDDMTWLRQAEQWDQYPMDLRWLAVASRDKSVLLHRYAWQRASMDLRYLTVLTGDLDWLHIGAERWRSTPAEIRLRAVAQRNPLLLCPAAIPLAAQIEEEAYAELRSEITESLPPLPFGLSPEEDLDISLQLHLASDRPSSMFWGQEGLQREKMQRDAEGVSAPPSLTVTGDAARPSVVKTTVSPGVPPAAKLQLGVAVEKKADIVAVSPSAKSAAKLTQPAEAAVQGKKEEASYKGKAFPQITGKPALSVEKKLPTVPLAKGATASPVEKKAGAALVAPPPSSADAKTAGVTGLPRTLKSPQAVVTKVPEGKEAQDTLSAGMPPSALPKLAPASLAKGSGETKPLERVGKKVGIPPPAAVVSEAGVEAGVEQKIPGPPGEKVAAQSSTPPFISKTGFPLKKGAEIKAAEGPAAATASERKAPILDKVHEDTTAAGKTDGTPSAVTPAGEKPGKKAGPPGPPKIGGPPGAGPPSGKTSALPPQTDKISAPSSPTGKLSAPPPPAGKVSVPLSPADKVAAPPPPTGKVSARPAPAGKVSAPPTPAGKISAPPAPAGKVSAPPPPARKVSAPPTPTGKVSAPPPPEGKVSVHPPPADKLSAPPPPPGKTSAAAPPPGKTSAAPPPPGKMAESPSIPGKVSAPPAPAGKAFAPPAPVDKVSAPLAPAGKVSAPLPPAGKVSAPPPPPGKTSAPPPTPPAGKEKMAFRGEVGGLDGGGEIAKKVSSSKEPSLESNATAEDAVAKASDVVSAQKLGMPIVKKPLLAAKGPPVKAPASKMAEDAHVTVGSDEASAGSKLAGAEDSSSTAKPSLPQTAPVQGSQVGNGAPPLAENAELQQHKIGAKPPGKPPQVKKALGFPPKKTMPPSVPKKMPAPPPT